MATYQIFVKHIDGHTQCLKFSTPKIQIEALIKTLALPYPLRLVTGTLTPASNSTLCFPFPTVHVLPRLRGGKGGFGSLLRGAASKAGQKKTNNFDACRDMSGRRLRHVNAEKKLEEWKEEEEKRKLEKLGEEYVKKKGKEVRREKGMDGEVEKYMERARKESEKCMEMVESSVRESFGLYRDAKRKGIVGNGAGTGAKKMKIWMGKKNVGDSDSDSDDEEEDAKEKSVVLNDETCTIHNNEEEGTSKAGSMITTSDGESSGKLSEHSDSEEVIVASADKCLSGGSSSHSEEVIVASADECLSGGASENCDLVETNEKCELESTTNGEKNSDSDILTEAGQTEETSGTNSAPRALEEVLKIDVVNPPVESLVAPAIIDKEVQTTDSSNVDEPLNFDMYNSAAELEVLGMERLKAELQSRGLKCGGTLHERAARLFLLKTTPFDKLPKKILAARAGGK